jgi:hypothetical protein
MNELRKALEDMRRKMAKEPGEGAMPRGKMARRVARNAARMRGEL